MEKKTVFMIVALAAVLALLSISAICSQCSAGGLAQDDVDSSEVPEQTMPEEESSASGEGTADGGEGDSTPGDEDPDGSEPAAEETPEEAAGGTEQESGGEPPTITLSIHQEAVYSSADDVCYWRIKAETTGDPEISWSRDNSFGAFGDDIAQVNLSRGESYTLVAEAANGYGTAEASIALDWACDDGGEALSEMENMELGIVPGISGSVTRDESVFSVIFVGDHPAEWNYKAFMSFDITGLEGAVIDDASFNINGVLQAGDPLDFGTFIYFHHRDYGPTLDGSDYSGLTGGQIFSQRIDSMGSDISYSGENLVYYIQEAVDDGKDYFQVSAGLGGAAARNEDSTQDGYRFPEAGIKLSIEYHLP